MRCVDRSSQGASRAKATLTRRSFFHRDKMAAVGRWSFLLLAGLALLSACSHSLSQSAPKPAASTPVSVTSTAMRAENAKPGTSQWQITQSASSNELAGFASRTSVNHGSAITLYVNTDQPTFILDVYRMGWYQGLGAHRYLHAAGLPGIQQPPPRVDPQTRMVYCVWQPSYTLHVPISWPSGFYLAKLTDTRGGQSYIVFVVRDDTSHATFVLQSPVTTYQAYNHWGGRSLYGSVAAPYDVAQRSYAVSFDRPYDAADGTGLFLTWEYPMVRWLERNAYDVTYITDIDTDEQSALLLQHRVFLTVGHDEYWTANMRAHVLLARNNGVSLGFFAGDVSEWQIRLEPSPLGPDRVELCYKVAALDPYATTQPLWTTVRFRDPPVDNPENALVGVWHVGIVSSSADLVLTGKSSCLLRGTGLHAGSHLAGLIGYEYDALANNGFTPPGIVVLARSPVVDTQGTPNQAADTTWYAVPSGALVFAAGTMQWSWGLDSAGGNMPHQADARWQRYTRNLLLALAQGQDATCRP
jgi:hypothetical protein